MPYTIQTKVDGNFDEVLDETESALSEEGFGILSDIDMGGTISEKLDEDFQQYRILGACNPPLAFEALSEEIDLGALLPCNVAVYEAEDGQIVVSAADPMELIDLANNPELNDIASEVEERIGRALDEIGGQ